MNTSKLFKNAIINLYKDKIYTVDFAILKASDYADKNKITAEDYEELITYLAEEQEKSMQMEEDIADNTTEEVKENKGINNTENVEETEEEV
nr:MAG TPA: hypothetical protein [Caudoviricetes sp.]